MNEDLLRKEIIEYISKTGVKQKFIAEQLGIDVTLFSRWKNGKRNLRINDLYNIYNYIHILQMA